MEDQTNLVELARLVGETQSDVRHLDERFDELVGLVEKTNQRLERIQDSIPPNHIENHEVIDANIKAAKAAERYWMTARCYIYEAIGTNTRKAIFILILAGIVFIAGYRDAGNALLSKAGQILGLQ